MEKSVFAKVFAWMFLGLLLTFGVGYYVSTNEVMLEKVFSSSLYWVFLIAEFALVIFLSARVTRMNPLTAKVSFLLYSFVSGLTFSCIFVAYEITSILYVFLISSSLFGIFALLGYFTKIDLSKIGTILVMALLGIILCMVVNLFLQNNTFDLIVTCISLLVFFCFTAYDIQKIKRLGMLDLPEDNIAIYGALELYLDFINIFLDLLNLMGKSKD